MKTCIKRAWHGTTENFAEFKCPAFFTDNPEQALFFAERQQGTVRILECALHFENAFAVDIGGQSWGGFFLEDQELFRRIVNFAAGGSAEEMEYYTQNGVTTDILCEYMEKQGYDGVIAENVLEENNCVATQYAALHPSVVQFTKDIRRGEEMFISGVILKNRCMVAEGTDDSQAGILKRLGMEDTAAGAGTAFVLAQLIPPGGRWWTDPVNWEFHVNQEILPEWYKAGPAEYATDFRQAVKTWWKEHVLTGKEVGEFDSGCYWLKDCGVTRLAGDVHAVLDNSVVQEAKDNSVIEEMSNGSDVGIMRNNSVVWETGDNSVVHRMMDGSIVKRMYGDSIVEEMHDNSIIWEMYDNSMVEEMHGYSGIREMYGISKVGKMYDESRVEIMSDDSMVHSMYNKSRVKVMSDGSVINGMYDESRIISILDNSIVREMYGKSGVWYISDDAIIQKMCGDSWVREMRGSSWVREMRGSSWVGVMYGNSRVHSMYDYTRVQKMCGDSRVDELHGGAAAVSCQLPDKVQILVPPEGNFELVAHNT